MALPFVDRVRERAALDAAAARGGLVVVHGRRRAGKTRLLREWLAAREGLYTQALEGPPPLQVAQAFGDIRSGLATSLVPRDWAEFLEILSLQKRPWTLCIDEFPYLAAADPTLPSRLQAWIDGSLPAGCLLVLAGSSLRMMHGLFLHRAAPLFGRARRTIPVDPLSYGDFCEACDLDPAAPDSFEKFACVGGVPKYWESLEPGQSPVALAHALYFDFAPAMEQEPSRILADEGLAGRNAPAVLEAVGRGAERPSEIAARLGVPQTGLSRVFHALLDGAILRREIPWGESLRSSKRVLYRIADPALRFWYRVYSPHRSLWASYRADRRRRLVHDHAATVFEDHCRSLLPGAARWWEGDAEFDLVGPDPERDGGVLVVEVKWRTLRPPERRALETDLAARWRRASLRGRHPRARLLVVGAGALGGKGLPLAEAVEAGG